MVLAGIFEDWANERRRARQEALRLQQEAMLAEARAEALLEGQVDILSRLPAETREGALEQLSPETRHEVERLLRDRNGDAP